MILSRAISDFDLPTRTTSPCRLQLQLRENAPVWSRCKFGIEFLTGAAPKDPSRLQEASVVGRGGTIASRHPPKLDGRGAAMLMPIEGNCQCLQPLAPWGRAFNRDDGHLKVFAGLVMERPERRSCRVGIAIGHELAVDASEHAEPLAQGHRAHARLPDVDQIV